MEPKVRRLITRFRHKCDHRDSAIDVTHIPYDEIRGIVPAGPEDPLMYDSYRLSAAQVASLRLHVREEFDLGQYDYYLETEGE